MIDLGAIFYPTTDEQGNKIPFDSLYLPYIWKEIYFDGVYHDVLNQRKDMVILDVGSQIGLTVKHFVPYSKKVYAIEPSPESFAALKKNKEFNKWDNVEIFEMALADKDGEMAIHFNPANRTCNSLTMNFGQGEKMVKTMAFDTFLDSQKIDVVDFCKFDTEGSEDMILRSEGFKKVAERVKSIEVAFHNNDWPRLAEYMVQLGYVPRRYPCAEILVLFTRP